MPDPGAAASGAEPVAVAGQPCIRLRHACGDTALVALHGAQLLSWTAGGDERLYLSPGAVFDGASAIRGGVPVCFPQFNQRGPLPKHGFARHLAWQPGGGAAVEEDGCLRLSLSLADGARSRRWWPEVFAARMVFTLGPGSLRIELQAHNPGASAWAFTGALHTYFRVDDIGTAVVEGLGGCVRWDAVRDVRDTQPGRLRFEGEYDSVFAAPPSPLVLRDGTRALEITQSATLGNVVVWNPGPALCARLADMPDEGFRHMLCVEAAHIDAPVPMAPGARWSGWQQLSVRA